MPGGEGRYYDVAPDGRLLMLADTGVDREFSALATSKGLVAFVNFFERIQARMPN